MKSEQTAGQSILLMSPERVQRSLNRMAYQIAEDNRDASNFLVFGLKKRGYAVARILADKLQKISSREVDLVHLPETSYQKFAIDTEVLNVGQHEGGYAVIVDDVIFSGRTMMAAAQQIMKQINAATLRTATLVDRGHRNMPVEATFSGLELPTKLDEHVEVCCNKYRPEKVILNKATN